MIALAAGILWTLPAGAHEEPPAQEETRGWTLGGYGEALVTTRFFGPDPNEEYDPSEYRQTDVDLARVVFLAGYGFTDWLSFRTEIEIEHGGTGAAMEVEWEEFGEYEAEIEKGGEIVLEQALLEFDIGRALDLPADLGVRIGHLLVPVGTISDYHLPTLFAATRRPEAEEALIPSTWHETGAEVFGRWAGLHLRVQAVTGLDSTGFSSGRWIAGGSQRRFETVRANDWAVTVRADYAGLPGLMAGASFYTSGTTGNRPKRDMEGVDSRVFIGDLHLRFRRGPFRMAALGMMGWLTEADRITEKNASLSKALEVPRTPVASAAYAYYLEVAFDVLWLVDPMLRHRLDLFVRHDGYDTMWKPPESGSGFDNPLLERRVLTAGFDYFPHPRVVLKGEYVSRWINRDDRWGRRQHEVNFALGFVL